MTVTLLLKKKNDNECHLPDQQRHVHFREKKREGECDGGGGGGGAYGGGGDDGGGGLPRRWSEGEALGGCGCDCGCDGGCVVMVVVVVVVA